MSGILGILVPVLGATVYEPPVGPWDDFIFNDDESTVAFTAGGTTVFNLTSAPQEF